MKRYTLLFFCVIVLCSIFVQDITAQSLESDEPAKNTGITADTQTASETGSTVSAPKPENLPPADSALLETNENTPDSEKQSNLNPPEVQSSIRTYAYEPIRAGDQYMRMGLQLDISLFNSSRSKPFINSKIYPGGSIFLGYAYYITKHVSLGGDVAFSFSPTIGSNLYFSIPFLFTTSYTFAAEKWRFPLSFGIGGNFQSCNGAKYVSLMFKPQAGFFYQYSPEWSFGGELSWDVVPQWYKKTEYNRVGNFLDIGFAVRYHF